jgi:hypothetical protein
MVEEENVAYAYVAALRDKVSKLQKQTLGGTTGRTKFFGRASWAGRAARAIQGREKTKIYTYVPLDLSYSY